MLELLLSYLATYGVQSNLVVNSGAGVLIFGREKRYVFFRYISALFLMLGVVLISVANYFLTNYVYTKFDLIEIQFCVVILLAGLYNLLISFLWKKMSSFGHYLYENSCSFAFDLVFIVFVVMNFSYSLELVEFLISVAAAIVVIFVMNVLIGFYVKDINSSKLNVNFRNVSSRLYLMAIFSMLLYYANLMIV